MGKTAQKSVIREKRRIRVRKKILGTPERPRLNVFRSAKHIYAQLIDDVNGVTLAATSSTSKAISLDGAYTGNKKTASVVGSSIAALALSKGINTVVFDRNGFLYHGRIQSLADAAREAGLKF
ncbi:MAG: 50S ribosomal protein L18 [Trichlorobacter sp.]|nr:50S ribosomal protein L18 [Trichlorobacter sp.]